MIGIDPKWRKQAQRLLQDPEGRAALKHFGIEVQVVGGPDKKDERPIVAVLCPTYRAPEPKMRDALAAMAEASHEEAIVYAGPPISASIVHWSRNSLITEQLKSGKPWTHVLFIDDDIVVEPNALVKLLRHKKDIVAGLCTRRQDPPIPNIRLWSDGGYNQIWDWPAQTGLMDITPGGVGTGFMLLSRNALEQVGQAYFDCLWEQDYYGMSGDKLKYEQERRLKYFDETKICYWFRFLLADRIPIEYGEDISFCHVAWKYCNMKIYVDVSVQPGHIGPYEYGIKDFLPFQQECIEDAKARGTFKPIVQPEKEVQLVG